MAIAELEVSPDEGEIPTVVCIALGRSDRDRVAQLIQGLGVLVVAPDLRTAHAILGRQVGPGAGDRRAPDGPVVKLGDLEIDEGHCRVCWRGMVLPLTRRERDLLARLADDPGRVWTYAQLHAAAWTDRFIGEPAAVHAAVKRLRRKLRDAGVAVRLDSVRGVGYQLSVDGAST
ncbi:MAG: winged helix-turn-helix domain-containing protein [Acidimicrobiales bacterium]